MEEALLGVVTTINNYLSNYILIILLLGMGIWFTAVSYTHLFPVEGFYVVRRGAR